MENADRVNFEVLFEMPIFWKSWSIFELILKYQYLGYNRPTVVNSNRNLDLKLRASVI